MPEKFSKEGIVRYPSGMRRFDKKIYYQVVSLLDKDTIRKLANKARSFGYNARVVKRGKNYFLYTKPKLSVGALYESFPLPLIKRKKKVRRRRHLKGSSYYLS